MAHGSPNSLDEMAAYLSEIREGRPTSPGLVEEMRRRYALVGGRSPLLDITRAQARALEDRLNAPGAPRGIRVVVGMRHWHPYIHEALAGIVAMGQRDVVALCLAPHYSRLSVGAYIRRAEEARESLDRTLNLSYVESWHTHPLFLQAIADKVQAAYRRFPARRRAQVQIVFTAHSLPVSVIEAGDPYAAQVEETAKEVAARLQLPTDAWQTCYQSAGATSVPWMGPDLKEVIVDLARRGQREILVVPVGFVADHVEILYDIDIDAREQATQVGVHLERTESLNATPRFIDALADIVRARVRER